MIASFSGKLAIIPILFISIYKTGLSILIDLQMPDLSMS